jgi:hypothetical protein
MTDVYLDGTLYTIRTALSYVLNDKNMTEYEQAEYDLAINTAKRRTEMATKCNLVRKSYSVSGAINSISGKPTVGGTGYSLGNILTPSGGTGANVIVSQVAAGVVTGVYLSPTAVGSGYSVSPVTGTSTTVSPAGGTGCYVNIQRIEPYLTAGTHTYDFYPIFDLLELAIEGVGSLEKRLGSQLATESTRMLTGEYNTTLYDWDDDTSGTPDQWMPMAGTLARLCPTPNLGGTLIAYGYAVSRDLVAETDLISTISGELGIQAVMDLAESILRSQRPALEFNAQYAPLKLQSWMQYCAQINQSQRNQGEFKY